MRLGNTIHIKLEVEKEELYKAEAAIQNIPLSAYIRNRLQATDDLFIEIARLRSTMEYTNKLTTDNNDKQNSSILIEILLLLRVMSQPERIRLVRSELERLGYNVWQSSR